MASPSRSDAALPLRRIANGELGDTRRAAVVLAALARAGYIRTTTMGSRSGGITDTGRAVLRRER